MNKSKCVLLIDGGWLLMSRFSVLIKEFEKTLPERVKAQGREDLKELMARSINTIINRFPVIDNLILTTEGGSWRKLLPVPESLSNITYKGNRSSDVELDWNYIYGAFDDLAEQCKSIGITVSTYQNVEGDDWIWYWTRKLNAQGSNCIIWSSDNDLKQLIQIDNDTHAFSVWYNDKNGFWLPEQIHEKEAEGLDFFFQQPIYCSPILESLKSKAHNKVSYIDPWTIVLDKVICGDSGDNIKPIVRFKKNNRIYGITLKDWHGWQNKYYINNLTGLKAHREDIIKEILNSKKYSQAHTTAHEINEMIDYNIQLVWLNEQVIPEIVTSAMNQVEYKDFDISYIKSNFRVLIDKPEDNDIQDIFDSIN